MKLRTGQILKRKADKTVKPKLVKVLTEDCEKDWLIRMEKENGETFIMHKNTIPIFYEPIENAQQAELFNKPVTYIDQLKTKYLR